MDYLFLKHLHVSFVVLSATGFVARGIGVLADAHWVRERWARVVPHIVDTGLLGSAVALACTLRVAPISDDWLTAKVLGLIAYIVLGSYALKRGRTRKQKAATFVAALLVLTYIVSVALTKRPTPWW